MGWIHTLCTTILKVQALSKDTALYSNHSKWTCTCFNFQPKKTWYLLWRFSVMVINIRCAICVITTEPATSLFNAFKTFLVHFNYLMRLVPFSIPPKNITKLKVLWCFLQVVKETAAWNGLLRYFKIRLFLPLRSFLSPLSRVLFFVVVYQNDLLSFYWSSTLSIPKYNLIQFYY